MPTPDARAARLRALAGRLGESPAEVATTLHAELARAFAEIDAALAAHDVEAATRATHAARNSVLMLDERAMLDDLRALDDASRRGDDDGARAARAALGARWTDLAAALQAS